jgi:CII-binding regulator of phage lambda lysogenization HflD
MVEDILHGLMGEYMRDSLLTIKSRDMVYIYGQMEKVLNIGFNNLFFFLFKKLEYEGEWLMGKQHG